MSEHLLSIAIGRCLGREGNLMRAYVPIGTSIAHALAMVHAANQEHGNLPVAVDGENADGSAPFAILVTERTGIEPAYGVTSMETAAAAGYRDGDRLAICFGRIPDLATFTGTFRLVMGPSWPRVQTDTLGLSAVATEALASCLKTADVNPATVSGLDAMSTKLKRIFDVLGLEYERLGSTVLPWNALWYRHVNQGLWLLSDAVSRAQGQDVIEVLSRTMHAAFSLPNPGSGPLPEASKLLKALADHWFDADSIAGSAALLARHPDWVASRGDTEAGSPHPMANLDWSSFGQTLAESGSLLLAFGTHELTAANRILAFESLTVREFLNPVAEDRSEPIEIFDPSGIALRDSAISGALHLIEKSVIEHSGDNRVLASAEVEVEIPLVGLPTPAEVESSSLQLRVTPRQASFEGTLAVEQGRLLARGRFYHKIAEGEFSYRPAKCHVSIVLDSLDSLTGYVQTSATAAYALMPPSGSVAVLVGNRSGVPSGAPTFLGWERFDSDGQALDDGSIVTRLSSGDPVRIIGWSSGDGATFHVDGDAMLQWPGRERLAYGELSPSTAQLVRVGACTIEVLPAEDSNRPISPIVAAARKSTVSEEALPDALVTSLRGEVEGEITRLLQDDSWESSLGHFFLPVDDRTSIVPIEEAPGGAFLTTSGLASYWSSLGALGVPTELRASSEAEEFRSAFVALGILESLRRDAGEQGSVLLWPSRVPWGHLWEERGGLERYLLAYESLLKRARETDNAMAVHWASYPFSVSAWSTRVLPAKCRAVYLSPLHPIRLAWLAAVEHTLRKSPEAPALAGAIEGWNFPVLGSNESKNGRMLAIPADSGQGGLFLGWSMLTRASIENPEQHQPPEYIANRRAPGSSASGLNGGGALAAIKDYRRLHPFATTLTIDLAASSEAPRLDEIDRAVLSEVADWSGSDDALIGGARILDSLNRLGDAPRDLLSETVHQSVGVPLVWTRYRPRPAEQPAANIRILQDAGVAVAVDDGVPQAHGLVGPIPLRRFEATTNSVTESATTASAPVLAEGSGWAPFTKALSAIESRSDSTAAPTLVTQLVGGLLASSSAEWTVSGESMVTPAALARQIQEHSSDQALWEWRPPFLNVRSREESAEALLERRPFLSVVRIPENLLAQVQAKLSHAYGTAATREQATHVLRTLGARGVGLSSLIAIGGTHATGALGFYTALELLDIARPTDASQFVIPIDACDKFLIALAGSEAQLENRRRADLLVVRLNDQAVSLAAVEIKNYGFATPKAHFPAITSPDLNEPAEQLGNTQRLLEAIATRWNGLRLTQESERLLWLNSLAALVEAGARLSPAHGGDPAILARRLQGLIDGEAAVQVGRPILTYFQHGPLAAGHIGFETAVAATHAAVPSFSAFLADPAATASVFQNPVGQLVDQWVALVEASFAPVGAPIPAASGTVASSESVSVSSHEVPTLKVVEASPKGGAGNGKNEVPTGAQGTGGVASIASDSAGGESVLGDGVRFEVGELQNVVGSAAAYFWPGNTKLTQLNVGIAGDLGTGKTQLIKALVTNLRRGAKACQPNPLSVLVLDYKGDFEDEAFVAAVGGRVLHPNRIPLNFFELPSGYTRLEAVRKAGSFIDVLTQIYQGIGPVQQNLLRNVIVDAYATGVPPTIDEVLVAYRTRGGTADSVVGVLETFVLSEIFATRGDDLKSFEDLMRDSVTVVNLLDLGSDQKAKNAIVAMFLNQYYEYMSRLPKWPYQGVDPQLRRLNSYLLVDEATNIMQYKFDALEQLLLQGREFGVGVILSSQYLSHFKESGIDYGQALRTWFIHKVPNVTVQQLQRLGLPHATTAEAGRIAELLTHEAYYSSEGFAGRFITGTPFYRLGADTA